MSFSIQAAGKVADVIEQVKAHKFYPDTSQADAVREFLLNELQQWNTDSSYGVIVEVNGHHDTNCRNLNLVMRPIYLQG